MIVRVFLLMLGLATVSMRVPVLVLAIGSLYVLGVCQCGHVRVSVRAWRVCH